MSNIVKPLANRLKLIILKKCVLILKLSSIFLIFSHVIIMTGHVARVYDTTCHLAGKILHWNTAAA